MKNYTMMSDFVERLVIAAERYARAQEIQALAAVYPHLTYQAKESLYVLLDTVKAEQEAVKDSLAK